ncbi:MAG: DUF2760 domain-containing protein [Deltaproteobacteria bacterium]|nr:DUF2760 domain-containing protein [Deltaproteobacteria bacterium]
MGRVGLAFRCFFRVLAGKDVPEEALPAKEEPLALPPADEEDDLARAIQMLGLLQKEGRLIDFLQEDIDAYDDAQIGAAVRNIHRDCRAVLAEHMTLAPIMADKEESTVEVVKGFDPSTIRLVGNVTGEPPFSGVLRHAGWRAEQVNLPELPEEGDTNVIYPAEVELS